MYYASGTPRVRRILLKTLAATIVISGISNTWISNSNIRFYYYNNLQKHPAQTILHKRPTQYDLQNHPAQIILSKRPAQYNLQKHPAQIILSKRPAQIILRKRPI
jgi:hypothetical protein